MGEGMSDDVVDAKVRRLVARIAALERENQSLKAQTSANLTIIRSLEKVAADLRDYIHDACCNVSAPADQCVNEPCWYLNYPSDPNLTIEARSAAKRGEGG